MGSVFILFLWCKMELIWSQKLKIFVLFILVWLLSLYIRSVLITLWSRVAYQHYSFIKWWTSFMYSMMFVVRQYITSWNMKYASLYASSRDYGVGERCTNTLASMIALEFCNIHFWCSSTLYLKNENKCLLSQQVSLHVYNREKIN